jgi:transposase-like protein
MFFLGRFEGVLMNGVEVQETVGVPMQSSVEVVALARRRRFAASYKRRILEEVDRASRGEIGLILRREGLYSSQLSKWRDWRNGMTSKKKGSPKTSKLRAENQRLQKENARLKLKLRKAEAMLDLQKKAAEILRSEDLTDENEGSDS